LPDAPQPPALDLASLPRATPLAPATPPETAVLESDTQSRHGSQYLLAGNAVITYQGRELRADSITYDQDSGETVVTGHVHLTGTENEETLEASHGTYNLRTQTGTFYDVTGSVLLRAAAASPSPVVVAASGAGAMAPTRTAGFRNANPFLFQGRRVDKTGPGAYTIYDGAVTSCLLPHPDWQLFGRKFTLADGKAVSTNSTFTLLGVPVLFFPYVSHPVDADQRQSGLLIPVFGYSSASNGTGSKGLTLGEQVYFTLGRSADATLGSLYYSLRGFSENGTFRYRGVGDDFLTAHFSALQDRGFVSSVTGLYTNQGGEDLTAGFRRQLTGHTRVVGDGEYLSSYIYREVFTENFNQAVSSDITSIVYVTHQNDGYSLDGRVDRYQGLKVVPTVTTAGEEVKVFHAPSIDFNGIDHLIPGTPLLFSATASAAGLKRVQPNFVSSGSVERFDFRPELSLPLAFAGWHTLSSIAVRETAYTRSRVAPYGANAVPIELTAPINRADAEINIDIRPPVVERTFDTPTRWQGLFGQQFRHTIEPDISYRSVHGVDNFLGVLRFDDVDLISDTDELKYALTQHIYVRPRKPKPSVNEPASAGCPATSTPSASELAQQTDAVLGQPGSPQTTGAPGLDSETWERSEPDALVPAPQATVDANGIPNASTSVPDTPTRTHARHANPCTPPRPQQQEWFTWELAQKVFFNQNFGGAVINRRRNIFDTTLEFSGIAFLTEPRAISPLVSRMRFRTSSHTDIAWDFDYDTGAGKFNRSNTFLDVHEGKVFAGFSYARLNAPGRFYTEDISATNIVTGLTGSAVSNFSQVRFLLGYGEPTRAGLSAAASAGIDLNLGAAQYITIQSSYNWNCCGLSVEYRRYNLGTVRDEGAYRFNFTLANIGTAGNLRRTDALF